MLVSCMKSSQGLVSEKNSGPYIFGKILICPILPRKDWNLPENRDFQIF